MTSLNAGQARSESGFTLIDMLFVIAIMGLLSTLAIPGLMRANGAAQSASALGTVRVVNSAQLSFAITCGYGFYSPDLQTLGRKPPLAAEAFLAPEFSAGPTFIKSGYNFSLGGTAVPGAPASCNGLRWACHRRVMRSWPILWTSRHRRAISERTLTARYSKTLRATWRPCLNRGHLPEARPSSKPYGPRRSARAHWRGARSAGAAPLLVPTPSRPTLPYCLFWYRYSLSRLRWRGMG